MKTISIIIIAIVISIAICKQINRENKYLKLMSLLKAATNLNDCTYTGGTVTYSPFARPASNVIDLYEASNDKKKFSYISATHIAIVELHTVATYTKFSSIKYYSYKETIKGDKGIYDITGKMTKHLIFNSDGTTLSDKSIFYETTDTTAPTYEIQLIKAKITAETDIDPTIQSTCEVVKYSALAGSTDVSNNMAPFLLLDHAEGMVATGDREITLIYATILNKRMTKVDGTKYTTFYTKDNKICSISYDGVGIYTVYYSESPATPVIVPDLDANHLATIPEPASTTFKSYTLDCKGDSGSKECTKSTPEVTSGNMGYTMVQSKTAPKPLYVFKSVTYWGKSTATDKLSMEPASIEEIAKIWDGCVIDIEKVNNIGIYKYNIIILFIISLIYIL